MIRKALFLLFLVVLLCAASDWRRFKERARPALQPLIDWTQREGEPGSGETELPSGPDLKSRQDSPAEYLLREPEMGAGFGTGPRFPTGDILENREDSHGQRIAAVDTALQRAQLEADRTERAIRQLEQATKFELDKLNKGTLTWSERRKRTLTIETESRRDLSALEAKRDLWQREAEKIQAMRNRLAQGNR